MRNEENSEHCSLQSNIMTFFTQTNSADCLHRISCTLCLLFTYYLLKNELKHSALELCSLFTSKQAFGLLQQIRKTNELKNTFYLHNRFNFLWLIQGSAYW